MKIFEGCAFCKIKLNSSARFHGKEYLMKFDRKSETIDMEIEWNVGEEQVKNTYTIVARMEKKI